MKAIFDYLAKFWMVNATQASVVAERMVAEGAPAEVKMLAELAELTEKVGPWEAAKTMFDRKEDQ